MKKTTRKQDESQAENRQLLLPLAGLLVTVKGALFDLVMSAGYGVLQMLLEQEREQLCGRRYEHDAKRKASRWGHTDGELVFGGRRLKVRRPRARYAGGKEVVLPSWKQFSDDDPLNERALEQMILGVATRKYGRSLETLPDEVKSRGTSKSAVSRRFVEETSKLLSEWLSRSLSGLSLAALMIDGIAFGEHMVLIALGIDEKGEKHILGLWEGATENAVACTALLSNLVERGLDTTRSILVVIDGGKGIAKAVRDVIGKRAVIQRCQIHKKRNVLEHLPERLRQATGETISAAYRSQDPERALSMLNKLARQLERKHPSAARSLREGLKETLTIIEFKLPDALERTLCTTNIIENLNGLVRKVHGNVKRWQGGSMILRWVAAGLQEAAKGFRRLKGYQGIPKLLAALRQHDASLDGSLAPQQKAA